MQFTPVKALGLTKLWDPVITFTGVLNHKHVCVYVLVFVVVASWHGGAEFT